MGRISRRGDGDLRCGHRVHGARSAPPRRFGYVRVRDWGLATNTERIALLLGSANLMTAERCLAST